MPERIIVKINENDNVAVAIHDLPAGAEFLPGLKTREPIPQAHKIALTDIPKGGEIIRYGVVLGYAKKEIPTGSWINEFMLDLPESPKLDNLPYGTNLKPMEALPMPERTTWMGYRNKVGPAGTRNLLGIVTTVQCAAGVLKVAVERIRKELLPKYPHVDGVVAVTHPYGCGVAINAPEAKVPIRAVTNLIRHPNFGGEIMVVGLGCEKLTYDRVLPPEDITPENVLTLQDYAGHDAMMQAILDMADKKLQKLEQRRREELPVSAVPVSAAAPPGRAARQRIADRDAVRRQRCLQRHHRQSQRRLRRRYDRPLRRHRDVQRGHRSPGRRAASGRPLCGCPRPRPSGRGDEVVRRLPRRRRCRPRRQPHPRQ